MNEKTVLHCKSILAAVSHLAKTMVADHVDFSCGMDGIDAGFALISQADDRLEFGLNASWTGNHLFGDFCPAKFCEQEDSVGSTSTVVWNQNPEGLLACDDYEPVSVCALCLRADILS